jgi:hypothetical protein
VFPSIKFPSINWANLGLGRVSETSAKSVLQWRYGQVETRDGLLVDISGRWWPWIASQWDVWRESYIKGLPPDVCRFYYAFPIRAPGFMAVLYAHSGPRTRYPTIRKAIQVLEDIAHRRNAQAIVCQSTNDRLDERMMRRHGYTKHALTLGNNHYIKRLNAKHSTSDRIN